MNRISPATSPLGNHLTWPFRTHVHDFVALNGSLGSVEGAEPLTRVDPSLDGAVVLLYDVVQVRTLRQRHRRPSFPSTFSSATTLGYDGLPSTLVTLGRGWPAARNALWKKRFAAAASR